ncbi:MAG: glycosyltransferase family 2 protein [Cyanobacteria bacterium P01_H01_bin.58]
MDVSLVTVYRRRNAHRQTLQRWWQQFWPHHPGYEWIVIEADSHSSPGLAEALQQQHIQYHFLPNDGTLHKTRALNLGLQRAQGQYVVPFDVDLIPIGDTLVHHHHLATLSEQLLMTGYRLMSQHTDLAMPQLAEAIAKATVAPEDQPTALRKHLLQGEKFGVMPFFRRQRLIDIQGWDEAFVGWGAEDQDLIERYLGETCSLCRSPELVYLHLHHEADPQWSEAATIAANRQHYYQKRSLQ